MKNINIQKIRQLTSEIRLFLRNLQNISSLTEKTMIYEAKADKVLALLPCETCGGLKVVPHGNWTNKPCPDCQPSKLDKVKPLAQYLTEYIGHEFIDTMVIGQVWHELLQQALDAYESTEQVKIRIELA